jgi:hypothetical protein
MKNAFKLRGRIEGAVRKNVRPMVPITVPLEENGEISAAALTPKPPNTPKPNKPSFRSLVQKNKEYRVRPLLKRMRDGLNLRLGKLQRSLGVHKKSNK